MKGVDAAGAAGNARPQRPRRSREVPSLEEKTVPECEKPAAKLEGMKGALPPPAQPPPLAQPPRVRGGPCFALRPSLVPGSPLARSPLSVADGRGCD